MLSRARRDYLAVATISPAFWHGWDTFFREVSSQRPPSEPLGLLPLQFGGELNLNVVYALCHPRGLPGVQPLHNAHASPSQQKEFWREVGRVRQSSPVFRHALALLDLQTGLHY